MSVVWTVQLELAAYLTHCNLQPAHLILALNLAMSLAFKVRRISSETCCCDLCPVPAALVRRLPNDRAVAASCCASGQELHQRGVVCTSPVGAVRIVWQRSADDQGV
jgi:hypothetical protein